MINIDNRFIHYEALGRGQPVIFIHGWLGSWRYWWPAMQGLSTQYRSFAFDLWGFGDSSKAKTAEEQAQLYNLPAYAQMIGDFIDRLGIAEPVTLVGHALGAAAALRYAAEAPDKVAKVAAIALPLQGSEINQRLPSMEPITFVSKVLGKSQAFSEVNGELRKTDPQAVQQSAAAFSQLAVENVLGFVSCSLLGVYGEKDTVVPLPLNGSRATAERAGGLRHVVVMPDCQHFPMLQETAKFNRLLLEFLHASSEAELEQLAPKEYWQRRTR